MLTRAALLLDAVNLRNLCCLYFLVSPFLLDRKDPRALIVLFTVGYVLSGAIVVLALAERLASGDEKIRFKLYSLAALALAGSALFSLLVNTPSRLFNFSLLFFKYGKIVFPMLAFFVMVNIWKRRDLPVLFSLLVSAAVLSLSGIALDFVFGRSYAGSLVPRVGFYLFGDPNKYAVFLNIVCVMVVSGIFSRQREGAPYGKLAVLFACLVVALLLTQSRGGLLAFAILMLLCVLLTRSRTIILRSAAVAAVFLVVAGAVFAVRYIDPVNATVSDLGRIWTYVPALNAAADNPLFGIGFTNTQMMYERYGMQYLLLLGHTMDVHNAVLEVFAQQGLLGLTVFLVFILTPLFVLGRRVVRVSRHRYPSVEMAALGIPLAFFLHGMLSHQFIAHEFFWTCFAFTVIAMRGDGTEETRLEAWSPKLV